MGTWKNAKDLLKEMGANRVNPNLTTYSLLIGIVWPNCTVVLRRKTRSYKGGNPERLVSCCEVESISVCLATGGECA